MRFVARRFASFLVDTAIIALPLLWVAQKTANKARIEFVHEHLTQSAVVAQKLTTSAVAIFFSAVVWVLIFRKSVGKCVFGLSFEKEASIVQVILHETLGYLSTFVLLGVNAVDALRNVPTVAERAFRVRVVDDTADINDTDSTAFAPTTLASWSAAAALMIWAQSTGFFIYRMLWYGAVYLPHEAGHLIAGLAFPHLVAVAGGTFLQLLVPALVVASLARRGRVKEAAFTLIWLALSYFYTAEYAADAFARELPLPVAMGDELTDAHLDSHDFWQLFSAFGVLRFCDIFAKIFRIAGIVSLLTAVALVSVREPDER